MSKNISGLVLWATILLAGYGCYRELPEPAPKTPDQLAFDKMQDSLTRCRYHTEASLADPEGFDPEPYGQWIAVEASEDRYLYQFKARAKNAFGGMIWAEFECTVTHDGTGWTAKVKQL